MSFFFLGLFLLLDPVVEDPLAAAAAAVDVKGDAIEAEEAVLQVLVVDVALEPLPPLPL